MPDRYKFLRKIAQGGFGRVYVAEDMRLGREVAIKRLLSREESASFDQAQATFEREATTLAALQHPNIVQIYDFDRDEEGTFVVMEMLQGETLKDRLNRGPLTWDTFVSFTRQALDAINAAHLKGVLHRDLKPENLFLHRSKSGTRVLKILDFGLAKLSNVPSRQTMDQSGNVFGSIYYMAPEQFMREPLDGRTDLYALGCVFYQALTAKFPFHGENMQGNMEAHMQHDVKPVRERRPDLPAPVCDWLMRLISFLPADRPSDTMTALREFEAALEGKTLQPAPKSSSSPSNAAGTPARLTARPTSRPGTPPTARPTASGTSPSSSGVMRTPMQTRAGSALEASRADAKAKEETASKRKRLALMIGVPVAGIVLVAAFLLLRPAPKSSAPAVAEVPPPVAKAEVAVTPTTTRAGPSVPPLPDTAPLPLPQQDALMWRFRAGLESKHKEPDGKFSQTKLERGQTVDFWKNLAAPEKFTGLLLYLGKPERAPVAQSAEVNGPGTGHTFLHFYTNSGMELRLKAADLAQAPGAAPAEGYGVTVAAVFRASVVSKETVMRPLLLSSANAKHNISLHFNHRNGQYWAKVERDGVAAQSLVTPEEFANRKTGAAGSWVAAVATWDAQNGTVILRVRSPDGKVATGPSTPVAPGMAGLHRVNLGFVSAAKDAKLEEVETFDGDIIEVAVYRRALDTATQEKVLAALWGRYFKKR